MTVVTVLSSSYRYNLGNFSQKEGDLMSAAQEMCETGVRIDSPDEMYTRLQRVRTARVGEYLGPVNIRQLAAVYSADGIPFRMDSHQSSITREINGVDITVFASGALSTRWVDAQTGISCSYVYALDHDRRFMDKICCFIGADGYTVPAHVFEGRELPVEPC